MPHKLNIREPQFAARLAELLERRAGGTTEVDATVAGIIADVRRRGDAALIEHTRRLDRFDVTADGLAITAADIAAAKRACDDEALAALRFAAERIEAFHKAGLPEDGAYVDDAGVSLGWRWTPLDAVGIYVPGGLASYPSSLLMNAIPARVAGVGRRVMTVPTPEGHIAPLVLAAAELAGITEIYRVGGAQAVAALAYGTETIRPVDKIVGPGNAYVASAKRQVFGAVGIDLIAGPSEILIVADEKNDARWIAADLLSQAEHDADAQAVLITDSVPFAGEVITAVDTCLETLPRSDIAAKSWEKNGIVITVDDLSQVAEIVNTMAPEHLELAVADPAALMPDIRHAGAIFLGRYTPEAIGDYVGGPNHVLPTARSARFSSGLSTFDFLKRSTVMACDNKSLAEIGPAAVRLADCEGLGAHALSVRLRLESEPGQRRRGDD